MGLSAHVFGPLLPSHSSMSPSGSEPSHSTMSPEIVPFDPALVFNPALPAIRTGSLRVAMKGGLEAYPKGRSTAAAMQFRARASAEQVSPTMPTKSGVATSRPDAKSAQE